MSAPVLYGLTDIIPTFGNRLPVPVWLLAWIVGIIPVATLLLLLLVRGEANKDRPAQLHFDTHEEGGEAYILFEVEPEYSDSISRELSEKEGVQFAAAVWGQWDVIARVQLGTARSLVRFLSEIQTHSQILRTETHIVRNDQPQIHSSSREDRFAFLLLKLQARRTGQVLAQLRSLKPESDIAHVQHAAGILGAYDIALTVRYARDEELAKLVMQYAQRILQAETMTMPAIRGMTYVNGKSF
ncbi:MAG: Lrp/AsnC ligand binding domain-containing protein [Sphingomonas sp.]